MKFISPIPDARSEFAKTDLQIQNALLRDLIQKQAETILQQANQIDKLHHAIPSLGVLITQKAAIAF